MWQSYAKMLILNILSANLVGWWGSRTFKHAYHGVGGSFKTKRKRKTLLILCIPCYLILGLKG